MNTVFKLLAFSLTVCAPVAAQVVPEATSGRGLPIRGTLHYDLRYSQTAEFSGDLGDWQSAIVSGDVNYSNGKQRYPFMLNYGGGYSWTISGPELNDGFFQHVMLSQGIVRRKWSLTFSDSVSFTPIAPTTGFSGTPGTGEPIGQPNPAPPSGESILNVKTRAISSNATGGLSIILNSSTNLSVGGGSSLLDYPDGNAIDTNSWMANASLNRRLNARNSLSAAYSYTQYSYPGRSDTFLTNSAIFSYTRQWTRRLSTHAGIGPDWVDIANASSSSQGGTPPTPTVPNSTVLGVDAGVMYDMKFGSAGLNFSQGTNGGAGYLIGAQSDNINADYSREFGRDLTVGVTANYMRTAGLENGGVTNAKYFGTQATRRVGRYISVFGNYTAIMQSSSSALNANALSGLLQVVSFGIGYSPRETHLRH